MSLGHSDVIHYTRPTWSSPTDNVEEFIRQAKECGTVEVIQCAKPFADQGGRLHWPEARAFTPDENEKSEGPRRPWIGPWPVEGVVNMSK